MSTFTLPDSYEFTVSATGDESFSLNLSAMTDSAMLKGLVRGLKNICGDSVGAKTLTHAERVTIIKDKIARFESGEIGDGVSSVSDHEKQMRVLFAAWLVSKGAKKAAADELSRKDRVHTSFMAVVKAKSLDAEKAEKLYDSWSARADSIVATLRATDDVTL